LEEALEDKKAKPVIWLGDSRNVEMIELRYKEAVQVAKENPS